MRLAVHLDPVIQFKSGSRTGHPNPVAVSMLLDNAGVDGFVTRLSKEFTHKDVSVLKSTSGCHLNVEIPAHQDYVRSVLEIKPDMVTFLPENGQHTNGEGSSNGHGGLREYVSSLHAAGVDVCVVVPPELRAVKEARNLEVDAVSLDVSEFTVATNSSDALYHLEGIETASLAANKLGLQVSVFGGVNEKNIANLVTLNTLDELILGHNFFARAMLKGLDAAFNELRDHVRFLMIRNG